MAQENVGKGVREPRRAKIAGHRSKLHIGGQRDPEFAYRIVNDTDNGSRIARFIENDWEIVEDSAVRVGDKGAATTSREGGPVKVNVGLGTHAYLMRKRKEWKEQDDAAKQAQIDEREANQQPIDTYGSIKFDKSELKR